MTVTRATVTAAKNHPTLTYGAEAEDRINTLLKNLADADKSAGARWKEIMDIWRSDKLGQPLHYDVLPDGLPDTDELCIVVLGFQLNPDGTMREELVESTRTRTLSARVAEQPLRTKLLRRPARWRSG